MSVRYDKQTVQVRENVQLTIEADPGSIVYLLAEDERNRLLGTGNDLYQYQVYHCIGYVVINLVWKILVNTVL